MLVGFDCVYYVCGYLIEWCYLYGGFDLLCDIWYVEYYVGFFVLCDGCVIGVLDCYYVIGIVVFYIG